MVDVMVVTMVGSWVWKTAAPWVVQLDAVLVVLKVGRSVVGLGSRMAVYLVDNLV